jgi:hypothetical protein
MFASRTDDERRCNFFIKNYKSPTVSNSKRQKKNVGKLFGTNNPLPVNQLLIHDAQRIWPKLMMPRFNRLSQMICYVSASEVIGIPRLGHNANTAVLSNRAGRPSWFNIIFKPAPRSFVMNMIPIE